MTYLHHPHGPDRHARLYRLVLILVLSLGAWGWSQGVFAAEPTHVAYCADTGVASGTPDQVEGSWTCPDWVSTLLTDIGADDLVLAAPTEDGAFWTLAGEVGDAWWSWDPTNGLFCCWADYWPAGDEDPEDPEEVVIDFMQSGVAFGAALTMCAAFWGLGKGIGAVLSFFRPRD